MRNFKNLKIWNFGIELVKHVYLTVGKFPDNEKFGLSVQCQKSAVSIPSNIAEGSSRRSKRDPYRFLEIALGSSFELETQIILAQELSYIDKDQASLLFSKIVELQKMITGYMKTIEQ
jgi:four helix bundle protein